MLTLPKGAFSQTPGHRYPEDLHFAEEGDRRFSPCLDTMRVLWMKQVNDIGLIFPGWTPVAGYDSVSVLEGRVAPIIDKEEEHEKDHEERGEYRGPHISGNDFPFSHYTHDFCFKIHPDSNYRYMLSRYVEKTVKNGVTSLDTVYRHEMDVEWESGLGAGNNGNPCSEPNNRGESCGFSTKGHKRAEAIWQWPSIGDWVHVEGLWIWDRGHPPAETEIHPIRFMAVQRNLPDTVDTKFATRVDLFANSEGGALQNNWPRQESYVKHTNMASKDYIVELKNTLPRPSPLSRLRFAIKPHPENTFQAEVGIEVVDEKAGKVKITVPWKSASESNESLLAQSVFLYWDEGKGVPEDYPIYSVSISLDKLIFQLFREWPGTRAELRMFWEVGGQYYFLNELVKAKEVINGGLGKTVLPLWSFKKTANFFVPADRYFRIQIRGWEADGVDKTFGHLIDPHSPCDSETKTEFNKRLINLWPIGFGSCLDDPAGETELIYKPKDFWPNQELELLSHRGQHEDFCPGSSGNAEDHWRATLTLSKLLLNGKE